MHQRRRIIHLTTFLLGLSLFIYAIVTAILFHNPRFYTLFALGAYLVLDYIDYKMTRSSIMTFFLNRRHWYAFPVFIILATIACFLVDFVLGVSISKMWRWKNYSAGDFMVMFLFMNGSFVLGMYEIFRIIRHFFEGKISDRHLVVLRTHRSAARAAAVVSIIAGILGLLAPFILQDHSALIPIEYVMLLPFVGLALVPDATTFLLRGKPVLPEILRVNLHLVLTLFFTVLIASLGTEILNLFGKEWEYLKMPFGELTILNVPLSVFIGWVPLVISTICIVTLVKHLVYLYDSNNNIKG